MSEQGPMISNDRELWREREGDYYANSIHVTETGGIGINVGGFVIVKPLAGWHKLAAPNGPPRLLTDGTVGWPDKGQDTPTPPTTEGRKPLAWAVLTETDTLFSVHPTARLAELAMGSASREIVPLYRASSPRVEDVRRKALRDAIFAVDQRLGNASPQREWDHEDHVREEARVQAINAIRSLSPPDGDGKQEQATRAEDGPTAPTDH